MPAIPRRTLLQASLASAAFATAAHAQPDSAIRGQQGNKATLKLGSSQATHAENAHGVMTLGFLFKSMEQQGAVMDGPAGRQLEDILKHKTKAEILGWGFNFGGRNVLSKKSVTTPADLRGLKLRVLPSPTFVQTFRLLGASPVPMSFGEIYTSLQTGVVDGLEHDPPTILQFKFYEVAKNLALTEHIFDPVTPIISTISLGRLTPAQQQAVREASAAAIHEQRGRATSAASEALVALKQSGVQVHDIERAALADAVKPLWTTFTDQHPDAKPVVEAILQG